jgi:hypothetical protein
LREVAEAIEFGPTMNKPLVDETSAGHENVFAPAVSDS